MAAQHLDDDDADGIMTRELTYLDGDDFVHATTYDNWVSIQTCSKGLLKNAQRDAIHLSRLHSGADIPVHIPGVAKPQVLIYVDRELAERDGVVFEPATADIAPDDDGETVTTKGTATAGFIPKEYFSKVVDRQTKVVLWENESLKKSRVLAERVKRIPRIDVHTHILPRNLDLCKQFGDPGYIYLEEVAKRAATPNAARDAVPSPSTDGHAGAASDVDASARRDGAGPLPDRLNMWKLRPNGAPPEHFRQIGPNCYCGAKRIEEMNDTDVDVQVLSTIPVMFGYWQQDKSKAVALARYLNDDIHETVRNHPRRYIGLGTVPLQFPDAAVEELERCMTVLGFRGVQIGSHVDLTSEFSAGPSQCWELSNARLEQFWKRAEELGAAIFVHPWDMLGSKESPKYWIPWLVGMPAETCRAVVHVIFSALLDRFPKLRMCFAHGGGAFPFTIGRIDHGFTCRPDICAQDARNRPAHYVASAAGAAVAEPCPRCDQDPIAVTCVECGSLCRGCDELLHARGKSATHRRAAVAVVRERSTRFWVDSLLHDTRALEFVINVIGENRVVLGSDYPFPLGEWHPGRAICANPRLTVTTKQQLLVRNACEFLGVKLEDYVKTDREGLREAPLPSSAHYEVTCETFDRKRPREDE